MGRAETDRASKLADWSALVDMELSERLWVKAAAAKILYSRR